MTTKAAERISLVKRVVSRFFMYVFLTLGAVIMLFPFYWMFTAAFKTTQETVSYTHLTLPTKA